MARRVVATAAFLRRITAYQDGYDHDTQRLVAQLREGGAFRRAPFPYRPHLAATALHFATQWKGFACDGDAAIAFSRLFTWIPCLQRAQAVTSVHRLLLHDDVAGALLVYASYVQDPTLLATVLDRSPEVPKHYILRALEVAAYNNNCVLTKALLETTYESDRIAAMHVAACRGNIDVMTLLEDYGTTVRPSVLDTAIASGQLHVLQHVTRNMPLACDERALADAAAAGFHDVLDFVHAAWHPQCDSDQSSEVASRSFPIDGVLEAAVRAGQTGAVYSLLGLCRLADREKVIEHAVRHGRVKLLESLGEAPLSHWPRDNAILLCAIDAGQDELSIVLLPYRSQPLLHRAACRGRLQVVAWLLVNTDEACERDTLDMVATHGSVEMLQLLLQHRNGIMTARAMDGAAANGNLATVVYLHENRMEGCTTAAMDTAARHNHLDVVRFLHVHRREGCTTAAIDGAARMGHFEMVKFLATFRREGYTARALDEGTPEIEAYLRGLKRPHL
ncbi:hypothetical protein SDRG_16461 [Saprolegnia diclina VS20]|uniref:Uncharacterized protein n=1 Tax=Saprolegnia diclina (strain VS20) TaxID=1156394 RepID=T0PXB8_SAPDV|nr:hypothetical protein SDRG_16461 [Saprolegnia diclina VS20]EQC25675.1 hypothetical protein SDRG_16461 [Saprolegnia diclina VS20]|eukprot:XP_008620894.1 hypothetical protein SDRG_16461 [Saprolegnia diclina VS20]